MLLNSEVSKLISNFYQAIGMGVDWSRVKEITLWQYDELIDKLQSVLSYSFVQEEYNQKLGEIRKLVKAILNYRDDGKYIEYCQRVSSTLRQIEIFGIHDIAELVGTIEDQDECVQFIGYSNILFEDLVVLLNCLLRWILPFERPIRDFVDSGNELHLEYLSRLRNRGIRNNLDIIEQCRTPSCRESMVVLADIPSAFLLDLVHRSDISRIPYVRGKTVAILHSAGYTTMERISNATLDVMIPKLEASLEKEGKKFSKSFMDPEGAIAQAKVLPRIIEI